MAIRTTATLIRGVVEIDDSIIKGDSDLDPFIATANSVVDAVCLDSDYSAATLELIERWLAAHFYRIRDAEINEEQVSALGRGGVQAGRLGKVDLGLAQTREGQMAMLVDTAGNLKKLQDGVKPSDDNVLITKATGTWLGE